MNYRLARSAEDQIDRVLLESASRWGVEAAGRYHRLMLFAFSELASNPGFRGSREIAEVPGVRSLHLRLLTQRFDPRERVQRPRHIVVYSVVADGGVEILGIAHERMILARAARRMRGAE